MSEKELFNACKDLSEAERNNLLSTVPDEVRDQIQQLLHAHDLNKHLADAQSIADQLPWPHRLQLDGFRIERILGQGGMGVVYLAEQRTPIRRHVAIKVIRADFTTHDTVERFAMERQVLALMEHEHIAKVFDAGITTEGRPYFVMEYVNGVPISDYVAESRLNLKERLALFEQVCSAIQHAHRKGVIHRDIKPNNILVVESEHGPSVKVIDFGIAKALVANLADLAPLTRQELLLGTPQYMSPEQIGSGSDIDTRTDVYSLGALLYELLTGVPPFDPRSLRNASLDELRRIIKDVDPPRPSVRAKDSKIVDVNAVAEVTRDPNASTCLSKTLEGDLDWIVMRCLNKERDKRYESPSAIALDLQRYLNNLPVEAGPPSFIYTVRKFVRRNIFIVTTVAALFTVLTIGAAGTLFGILWALNERAEYEKAAQLAQAAEIRAQYDARKAQYATMAAAEASRTAILESYVTNLKAADSAQLAGDLDSADAFLYNCPTLMRGWEWYHCKNRGDSSLATGIHTSQAVHALTVGADNNIVIINGNNELIQFDSTTLQTRLVITLSSDMRPPPQLSLLSPSGQYVAFESGDRLEIVSCNTGASCRVWRLESNPKWSPDGRYLFSIHSGAGGVLRVRDARTFSLICDYPISLSSIYEYDCTRHLLACQVDDIVRIYDLHNGCVAGEFQGHAERITCFAFSKGGTLLASLSDNRTVQVWDIDTARIAMLLSNCDARWGLFADRDTLFVTFFDKGVTSWCISEGTQLDEMPCRLMGTAHQLNPSDDRVILLGSGNDILIVDLLDGRVLRTLKGHSQRVTCASFYSDGHNIVSGSRDRTLKRWEYEPCNTPEILRHPCEQIDPIANYADFSEDGRFIITTGTGSSFYIWDAISGKRLLATELLCAFWDTLNASVDGIITDCSQLSLFGIDPWSSKNIAEFRFPWPCKPYCNTETNGIFPCSESSEWLVPILVDLFNGTVLACTLRNADEIRSFTLNKATSLVIMCCQNYAIIRNMYNGSACVQLCGHIDRVNCARFSKSGRLAVTASEDGTAKLWNVADGAELTAFRGHNGGVTFADIDPSETRVITASIDGTARIWDVYSGKELLVLREHGYSIRSAVFNPTGDCVLTTSKDGIARLWYANPFVERYEKAKAKEKLFRSLSNYSSTLVHMELSWIERREQIRISDQLSDDEKIAALAAIDEAQQSYEDARP